MTWEDNEYEPDDNEEDGPEDEEGGDDDGEEVEYYVLKVPECMVPPPFRMIKLKDGEDLDPREAVAVPLLHYARGCARQCPSRACRSADICQQPPLRCRLRPYAEVYDWDHDLPNGPRRDMYAEIARKHLAGCYTAFHFPQELKRFTPNLPAGTVDEEN